MKYKQMSIYDFIDEATEVLSAYEKSQEVQPSETVPQVDEAQERFNIECAKQLVNDLELKLPSSALDTEKLISENLVFNPEGYAEKVTELPTEDTDSTLFSVGDVLTVKSPDEVYSMDTHLEDYYHLQEHQGKKVVITSVRKAYRGVFYGTSIEENGKVPFFYHRELKI
ncbi:hypothetical protein [Bacillus cereus]|uniref:hypothetical protein n=1 Tax=Bacillus cereus TaxID=1396 RepID=UPI0011A4BA45|nr:hypothetical protein [Bacillus cereus]